MSFYVKNWGFKIVTEVEKKIKAYSLLKWVQPAMFLLIGAIQYFVAGGNLGLVLFGLSIVGGAIGFFVFNHLSKKLQEDQ